MDQDKDESMKHCLHKPTQLIALSVTATCLVVVALGLTSDVDDRVAGNAEEAEQPLQTDGQPQELIRSVESDLSEQFQDRMVQLRGHMADFKPEQTRNQRLREYFEMRDALELQDRMIEEFNMENRQQPFEVRIYIPSQNATE